MLEIGTKSKDMGQARHDSAQLDFGPPRATSTSERKKLSDKERERERKRFIENGCYLNIFPFLYSFTQLLYY
jgi:hypothetical protein